MQYASRSRAWYTRSRARAGLRATRRDSPLLPPIPSAHKAPGASGAPGVEPDGAPGGDPAAPRAYERYWTTILVVDAIAVATVLFSIREFNSGTEDTGLLALGLVGMTLGSPIVHGVKARGGNGLRSFGLRTLMPIGGIVIGTLAGCASGIECNRSLGPLESIAYVGLPAGSLAMLAAMGLDYGFLARKPIAEPSQPVTGLMVLPAVSSSEIGGATLSLVGTW